MFLLFFSFVFLTQWILLLSNFNMGILYICLVLYLCQPSVSTNDIDKAVHKMIIDAGAYPSPLGYGGFPKSVCTSVNECMCHGIPDSRQLQVFFLCVSLFVLFGCAPVNIYIPLFLLHAFPVIIFVGKYLILLLMFLFLQDGDIINIDVTVYLNVCSYLLSFYFSLCLRCPSNEMFRN